MGDTFGAHFSFLLDHIQAFNNLKHVASIGTMDKMGFEEEVLLTEYDRYPIYNHDARVLSLADRGLTYSLSDHSANAIAPLTVWSEPDCD